MNPQSQPVLQKRLRDWFIPLLEMHSKWIDLSSVGAQSANEYVNVLVQIQQAENNENWGILADDTEIKLAIKTKLEIQAQSKLKNLQATHEDLCNYFRKAKSSQEMIEATLWRLIEDSSPFASTNPVFQTSTFQSWALWSSKIITMFGQDLTLKKSILEDLPKVGAANRNTLMLYLSAWLTSPLVDPVLISDMSALCEAEMTVVEEEEALPSTPKSREPTRSPKSSSSKLKSSQPASKTPSPRSKK